MSLLTPEQRERLTPQERERIRQLVSDFVRNVITDEGREEMKRLNKKMGPRVEREYHDFRD